MPDIMGDLSVRLNINLEPEGNDQNQTNNEELKTPVRQSLGFLQMRNTAQSEQPAEIPSTQTTNLNTGKLNKLGLVGTTNSPVVYLKA